MLRIVPNTSAAGAKGYFAVGDYYAPGQQELDGVWCGKGAARLGLSGVIERADWEAMCDNLDPRGGQTLTARQKADPRVGFDFNWHVPKSVSLLYGLTSDPLCRSSPALGVGGSSPAGDPYATRQCSRDQGVIPMIARPVWGSTRPGK